jgi:uncharacterized protein YgiM (DUF1202 family)
MFMTRRRMLTVLALLVAILFMLAACAEMGPQPPPAGGAPIYYSNIAGLPLREGPTRSATQIATLQFNDEVQLLETRDGWGRVLDMSRNIEGWAAMGYLQPNKAQWPRQIMHQERPVPKQAAPLPPGNPPQPSEAVVSSAAPKPSGTPPQPSEAAVSSAAPKPLGIPPQPSEAPISKAAGTTPSPPIYYANIAGLPLRKEPTMSAPEIATLQFNDEVQLLETRDGWGRVLDFSRNIEGWTAMSYLQPGPAQWPRQLTQEERPAPQPPGSPSKFSEAPASKTARPPIYYANINGLPLRKEPATSAPKISILEFNDEVQLLETKDDWGRVLDMRRDIEGWAAMRYLQSSPAQWPRQFWGAK